MARVYDCFIFFNELTLLEIRLETLFDVVDRFVICESTVTFRGNPKPLVFQENAERFERFASKIIHVVVNDMPPGHVDSEADAWGREHFQRNAIRRGLTEARPDDIVIVSDCDEIIAPAAIEAIRGGSGYFLLEMTMFQFFMNMKAREGRWTKVFAYSFSLSDRITDYNRHRLEDIAKFEEFRDCARWIVDAGWHFTFLGGANAVSEKLQAYSHMDGWQRTMWDEARLAHQYEQLFDVGGTYVLQFVAIDATFPDYVVQHRDTLERQGFIKAAAQRVVELERVFQDSHDALQAKTREARELRSSLVETRALLVGPAGTSSEAPVNRLACSRDFSRGYALSDREAVLRPPDTDIRPPHDGNSILRHADPNPILSRLRPGSLTASWRSGSFRARGLVPGRVYTASCFIRIDEALRGVDVRIGIDGCEQKGDPVPDSVPGQWVRIVSRARVRSPEASVWLTIGGRRPRVVLSSCWQLEPGTTAGPYQPTDSPNLLPGSPDFGEGWSSGAQPEAAFLSGADGPTAVQDGSRVVRHVRNGRTVVADSNVGWFRSFSVVAGQTFTASAWIWLPETFTGEAVVLSVGEWGDQVQDEADLRRREVWQRIQTVVTAPDGVDACNCVLRVEAESRTGLFSCAWKLERGAGATGS